MDNHVVIMAGGIGSRLWPASTPELPKQFLDVLGVGKTLIQMTVERFLPICGMDHFWVVTSGHYADIVRSQLPGIPEDHILAEPEPRNTAPCIAYACRKIELKYPDANIVVTPSDALVLETEKFRKTISDALAFTADGKGIVTVGIIPTRPETGYGYICAPGAEEGRICKVSAFKEKPDGTTAKRYLESGNYFWNAGIFVWNVRTINDSLRRFAPLIAGVMDTLVPYFYTPEEDAALKRLFPDCDKISIDYAVMEKSDDIHVITGNLGWSDLGSWGSVKTHVASDAEGNSVVGGDVRLFGCTGCMVHLPDVKMAVIDGLEGYIVAEKNGRLLVCRLSEEQRIKDYSAKRE